MHAPSIRYLSHTYIYTLRVCGNYTYACMKWTRQFCSNDILCDKINALSINYNHFNYNGWVARCSVERLALKSLLQILFDLSKQFIKLDEIERTKLLKQNDSLLMRCIQQLSINMHTLTPGQLYQLVIVVGAIRGGACDAITTVLCQRLSQHVMSLTYLELHRFVVMINKHPSAKKDLVTWKNILLAFGDTFPAAPERQFAAYMHLIGGLHPDVLAVNLDLIQNHIRLYQQIFKTMSVQTLITTLFNMGKAQLIMKDIFLSLSEAIYYNLDAAGTRVSCHDITIIVTSLSLWKTMFDDFRLIPNPVFQDFATKTCKLLGFRYIPYALSSSIEETTPSILALSQVYAVNSTLKKIIIRKMCSGEETKLGIYFCFQTN